MPYPLLVARRCPSGRFVAGLKKPVLHQKRPLLLMCCCSLSAENNTSVIKTWYPNVSAVHIVICFNNSPSLSPENAIQIPHFVPSLVRVFCLSRPWARRNTEEIVFVVTSVVWIPPCQLRKILHLPEYYLLLSFRNSFLRPCPPLPAMEEETYT